MSKEQDNIIARTLLETSGNQMDKGATIQISRNLMGPLGELNEIANDVSYMPRVDQAGAGTDPELEEQVETNTENIEKNSTAISNLITIINDRTPDEQAIDEELLAQADKVWTFKFTEPGPNAEPNDITANYYQIGNRLWCDFTSSNNGTGPNATNNYLLNNNGSVHSTAINIRTADNGQTYTGNDANAGITPGNTYKQVNGTIIILDTISI